MLNKTTNKGSFIKK